MPNGTEPAGKRPPPRSVRVRQRVRARRVRVREGAAVHLLIVEDDDAIAAPLARGLEREGFTVTRVTTGAAALRARRATTSCCSTSACPTWTGSRSVTSCASRSDVPIIVVTARGDESDRVVGLELGADDYLVKPFGFRELVGADPCRHPSRRTPRRSTTAASGPIGALVHRRAHAPHHAGAARSSR